MKRIFALSFFLVLAFAAADMQAGEGGVKIVQMQLASQVGTDLRPLVPTRKFKPDETIYLAISTSATGEPVAGTLAVSWRYRRGSERQTVHNEIKELIFAGRGRTAFQITKPDGWPIGEYFVEVYLNGVPIGLFDFRVQ